MPTSLRHLAVQRPRKQIPEVPVDFSVFKEFPITERFRLQLRSEFFNLLNHPQFDLPGQNIGSPSAGVISGTVGTPRDIQFSLRLLF